MLDQVVPPEVGPQVWYYFPMVETQRPQRNTLVTGDEARMREERWQRMLPQPGSRFPQTLQIPFIKQDAPGLCAPAVLQNILNYYGHEQRTMSQAELAQALDSDPVEGVTNGSFVTYLESIGFECIWHEGSTYNDILRCMNAEPPSLVVVDWLNFGPEHPIPQQGVYPLDMGGHYSIVAGMSASHITLFDPGIDPAINAARRTDQPMGTYEMTLEKFAAYWFDFKGRMLSPGDVPVCQAMIAVRPKQK